MTVIFYQFLAATIAALIMIWLSKDLFQIGLASLDTAKALTISTIIGIAIASLLIYGFDNIDLNKGNIILATEIGMAAIFNSWKLKQIPMPMEIVGICMLTAAIIISKIKPKEIQE